MEGPTTEGSDGSEGGAGGARPAETGAPPGSGESTAGPVRRVQALLDAVRTDGSVEPLIAALGAADETALVPLREDRRMALAFSRTPAAARWKTA